MFPFIHLIIYPNQPRIQLLPPYDTSVALTLTFLRRTRGHAERNVRVATLADFTESLAWQYLSSLRTCTTPSRAHIAPTAQTARRMIDNGRQADRIDPRNLPISDFSR